MSWFNPPAFGGFGYDHASRPNPFDFRQSGNHHFRCAPAAGIAVPVCGHTTTCGYPVGCSYSFRYSSPFSTNAATCAPVFGHTSHPFGFTSNNGATFVNPIGCGTSGPTFGQSCATPFGFASGNGGTSVPTTFGQNSSTPFGFVSANAGTSVPAFGQSSATSFGSFHANGGTSMPAFGQNSATTFGSLPANGGTSVPAFGQNSATTFGSLPANGGTSMPAFGQNSTTSFGFRPANGGTSMPAFGQNSTTSFGFCPANGGTSVPAFAPFGQKRATPFGSLPANGGTSMSAFGQNSFAPFGSLPANDGTSMPAFAQNSAPSFGFNPSSGETNVSAFGQNSATLGYAPANGGVPLPAFEQSYTPFGHAPANGGTSAPAFKQSYTPFGHAPANGGTSVPAFGRSTNSFGFSTSNTTTSVPAWQCFNPLGPVSTNGATFASRAPLFSTLTQATPLSGSTTHFQTPTINASSFPGFGFGCTTSGHTSTQFGTSGNLNETSTCSDEIQSPFSGFHVKTPVFGDSSSGPLAFGVSRGGSRVTPYTETVELEPFSQQFPQHSTRFMSISAMPVYRDKCHEELRWEDKQFEDNGMPVYQDKSYEELRWEDHQFNNAGGVDPDSAQLNCFRNLVCRTGSSFQNAMPSSVPPNIFASKPPCFTFPTCTAPFTSNSLLNDSCEVAYTSIAQPPSFGPTITYSHPNPSITSASAGEAFTSGPSFLNYTSAPCASICSTSVTTPVTASVPCNIPPSISTLHDVSPSRCRAETPPAVPLISAEDPKTTSVRYGMFNIPVNHSANEKENLLQPPTCNWKGDGPKVTFCPGAHETPTARTKVSFLTKDNLGISITGLSEEWTVKIDFQNMSHIKHTSIHVHENGKVSVELSNPLADGLMYQDKAGNPCETFAAEHSLRTNSIDCNHLSEKEVPSNVYGLMPKLKHSDYFIEPRVEELAIKESFEPGFCRHVKDFVVGHQRYGRIKFFGETDVRQLDVNSWIVFGNREVILSIDENKKPPVGQGLNKPAEITLCNIKCVDKAGNHHISGPKVDKYKEKLKKKAAEQGAEFVSYDPVQGEWKFRVEHF